MMQTILCFFKVCLLSSVLTAAVVKSENQQSDDLHVPSCSWVPYSSNASQQGQLCSVLRSVSYHEPYLQLQELGEVTDQPGQLVRAFLSPAHLRAAALIKLWMRSAGMETHQDNVGNIHGRVRSTDRAAKTIIVGSHYDTVMDAGKYDGALGIIAGIAAVKALLIVHLAAAGAQFDGGLPVMDISALATSDFRFPFLKDNLEVIAFSDEEGLRFQTTFLGSKAVAGTLVSSGLLGALTPEGESLAHILTSQGFDSSERGVLEIARSADKVKAYLEVHMEQGPLLQALDSPLGVVKGIAGQSRLLVQVKGEQGHAGTVPMQLRKDPMPAAAAAIVALETYCRGGSKDPHGVRLPDQFLLCTVGEVTVWPGASNVIPSSVNFTIDIRSEDDSSRQAVNEYLLTDIPEICEKRGVACQVTLRHDTNATKAHSTIAERLVHAAAATMQLAQFDAAREQCAADDSSGSCGMGEGSVSGQHGDSASAVPRLVSGAGHDAIAMASLTGYGMIFVRCKDGISHSPLEFVRQDDVAASVVALHHYLMDSAVTVS